MHVVCAWGLLSFDCITLIGDHKGRLTAVVPSSLVSVKCPFHLTCASKTTHAYTHTHLYTHAKPIRIFLACLSPHISTPLLSTVTYHPATSAARHLLSESIWRPFNPPSKEVFPVNGGKRDPNTKGGGKRGGAGGGIRGEGLAERAIQLAPQSTVGLPPRHFFFSYPEMLENILHTDKVKRQNTALWWRVGGLVIVGQRCQR